MTTIGKFRIENKVIYSGLTLNQYGVALPYYLYCLRLRRLVLI